MGAGDDGYTLLFDMWVAANSARAVLDEALRPSGLGAEEFALYSAIRRDGGITPTELASLMALPPTTVSSIVGRLERRGHARRAPNPGDGRSYRIELTAAGMAAHAAAARLFAPVLAKVESALAAEVAGARALLAAIRDAVRAAADGTRRSGSRGSQPAAP
ncbi:MAG: MarR family winged helix-turn-helix transcriptional regulator [Streptosporangiaceae bacterium]